MSWLHLFVHATRMGDAELSLDEAGTWGVARRSLGTLVTLPTAFHSQPPLYYFILHGLIGISSQQWFLRGFSWLCFLITLQFVLFYLDELNLFARLFLCLLLIYADISHYLATAVRPYGLATLCTLVSTVLLTRLLREPTRRRAIAYALWALAMLYSMAFAVAVLLVHGMVAAATVTAALPRFGLRDALRRHRALLLAMTCVVIAYLPYLFMAIHYQYKPNPAHTLDLVRNPHTYENALTEQFQLPVPMMLGLFALCVFAVAGELRGRNFVVLLWPLLVFGQIAFVFFFIVGRSPIGAQPKYMMPAFLAVCMLAALGFQQLLPRTERAVWHCVPVLLGALVWSRYGDFHTYMHTRAPLGQFEILHGAMAQQPGKKLIFFDIGYEGQFLEHVIRDDANVDLGIMRGPAWATGGDNHLDPKYIIDTVDKAAPTTRCFFYYLQHPNGPYATAFVPTMQRLGYTELPALPRIHGHRVPGFCRN